MNGDYTIDFLFKGQNVQVEFDHDYNAYPPKGAKCYLCKKPVKILTGCIKFPDIKVRAITNTDGMFPIKIRSAEGRAIITRVKMLEKLAVHNDCDNGEWMEDLLSE